jgi:hypothetical protein
MDFFHQPIADLYRSGKYLKIKKWKVVLAEQLLAKNCNQKPLC